MSLHKKIIIEGDAKRESSVAKGFVNQRHFAVEIIDGNVNLASYRQPSDDTPSKTWKITSGVSLTDIKKSKFKLRTDSILASIAMQSYQTEDLHKFTVSFYSGALWNAADKLTLCFETAEKAQEWHTVLSDTIKSLPKYAPDSKSRSLETSCSDGQAVLANVPFEGEEPKGSTNTPTGAAAAASSSPSNVSSDRTNRRWRSVRHVNGVAMYGEDVGDEGESGAVMASSVVRAPPVECFHALMRASTSQDAGDLPFADSMTILETIDAHTHVVRHCWSPDGTLGCALCSPREMVALRTWRKDDDGTYIVLYQSTNHRKARETKSSWLPWSPSFIRAKVEAAGFTIAPLLPKYISGGKDLASQECLVTLVVKADLAGALAPGGRAARAVPAVTEAMRWALLEPLLMSVVRLRDRVEQSRFVVMPYSMTAEDSASAAGDYTSTTTAATNILLGDENVGAGAEKIQFEEVAAGGERAAGAGTSPKSSKSTGTSSSPRAGFFKRTSTSLIARTKLRAVAEEREADGSFQTNVVVTEEELIIQGATATAAVIKPAGQAAVAAAAAVIAYDVDAWASAGTTERCFWSYPGNSNLRIRGPEYLEDRVKIPAAAPMFDLYASDLVNSDEPVWHLSRGLPSVQHCKAPFAFILNLIYPVPAAPLQNLVSVWTSPIDIQTESLESLVQQWGDDQDGTVRAFFHTFRTWLEGDGDEADKRRNTKFKLIPRVAKGSWVVRQSVGTTPVLLGQKLKTKYFRGRTERGCSYFEVDVDITSNTVANSVTRLVVNSITSLVVDLAPLVEGQTPEELPERLIGTIRYDHLDLSTASAWDETTGTVVPKEPANGKEE